MKVLFLVDGAAGAGKSDLVNYVASVRKNSVTKIDKYTTRNKRPSEEAKKSDLIFITEEEFKEKASSKKDTFYNYVYGGSRYGFYKSAVDHALQSYNSTFIIIRNQELILKLVEVYENEVLVVPIYVYTDEGLIESRLRQDGYDEDTIKFRMERSRTAFEEYLANDDIYKKVIINRSSTTELHRKIKDLENYYSSIDKRSDRLYISPTQYFPLHNLSYYKARMDNQLQRYKFETER